MYWQLILPILLATFLASCSKNVANLNIKMKSNALDNIYLNYPIKVFEQDLSYKNIYDLSNNKEEKKIVIKILENAKQWRYTPYRLGGVNRFKGADCSAFTQQVFKEVFNIRLERSSFYQKKAGKSVPRSRLKAGDLLFFKSNGPHGMHVGIYLENGSFIHLSSKGGTRIQSINVRYWSKRFLTARRLKNVK